MNVGELVANEEWQIINETEQSTSEYALGVLLELYD